MDFGRSVDRRRAPHSRYGSLPEIAATAFDPVDGRAGRIVRLCAPTGSPLRAIEEGRSGRVDGDRRLPEDVPVTEAEIDVFEAWFGNLFDELFSPRD